MTFESTTEESRADPTVLLRSEQLKAWCIVHEKECPSLNYMESLYDALLVFFFLFTLDFLLPNHPTPWNLLLQLQRVRLGIGLGPGWGYLCFALVKGTFGEAR